MTLLRAGARLALIMALAACHGALLPVPEAPPTLPVSGAITIGSLQIKYELLFEQDSLRQIAQVGNSVVVLTSAGVLVRFDGTSDGTAAIISPSVACMALDARGRLLVGLSDGTIGVVTQTDLRLDPIAQVRGEPRWIGETSSRHLVVVVDAARGLEAKVVDVSRVERPRVTFTARVPNLSLPAQPTSFLIDRRDRLWFGIAAGEWGGAAGTIDLKTGRVETVELVDLPVRGFLEPMSEQDGLIWIYGGLAHLSRTYSFLVSVRGTKARPSMWRERSLTVPIGDHPALARELFPVDRLAIAGGGKLWAVVAGEVFLVDKWFQEWKLIGRLLSDRDDGNAVVEVAQLFPTGHGEVLVASTQDGWFRVSEGHIEAHRAAEVRFPQVDVEDKSRLAIKDREGWTWRAGPGTLSLVDGQGVEHDLSGVPGIKSSGMFGLDSDLEQTHGVLVGFPGLVVRVSVVR